MFRSVLLPRRTIRRQILFVFALCVFLSAPAPRDYSVASARRHRPIPALKKDGTPNIQSTAAVVLDAKTGKLLHARNPDTVRYIASTTKIFVALVVRARNIDLDAHTAITKADAAYAKGGSRTRLVVGHRFRNQDLLRAMLIASDNRAPSALGRAVGLSGPQLIRAMNRMAKKMGLTHTRFTDPSGLNGNKSTAREMAIALGAAMKDPFLASIMSTTETTITSIAKKPHTIVYRNTNRSLHTGRYDVLGGKTGFTSAAGYCLLIDAKIKSKRVQMAFLGAKEELTRFGDFGRVATWLEKKYN